MLQVAINPLLRVAGGEEHFAFNEVLAQLLFGAACFLSPLNYSFLVLRLASQGAGEGSSMRILCKLTPPDLPWVSVYGIFAVLVVGMLLVVFFSRFPKVPPAKGERPGTRQGYRGLLRRPVVWVYFLATFSYVGGERGRPTGSRRFSASITALIRTLPARAASPGSRGLMTLGCLAGVILLKLSDSRRLLIVAAGGALIGLSFALFSGDRVSLAAFPAVGLCCSVMWPVVISLALNSVAEHHGSYTGILATEITGSLLHPGHWAHRRRNGASPGGLSLPDLNLLSSFSWASGPNL